MLLCLRFQGTDADIQTGYLCQSNKLVLSIQLFGDSTIWCHSIVFKVIALQKKCSVFILKIDVFTSERRKGSEGTRFKMWKEEGLAVFFDKQKSPDSIISCLSNLLWRKLLSFLKWSYKCFQLHCSVCFFLYFSSQG